MSQPQEQQQQVNFSINDLIMIQLRDLKESQRDIKAEIKDMRKEIVDVRKEINDVRKEINDVRKEINERIDRLASKIDSSSNHGQISNITTIGIALAVIYSILK